MLRWRLGSTCSTRPRAVSGEPVGLECRERGAGMQGLECRGWSAGLVLEAGAGAGASVEVGGTPRRSARPNLHYMA